MYNVTGFHLWNCSMPRNGCSVTPGCNSGIKNITVSFGTDGGYTFSGSIPITCTKGPDSSLTYSGETYTFPRTKCNAVKLTLSNDANCDYNLTSGYCGNFGSSWGPWALDGIRFIYQNAWGS